MLLVFLWTSNRVGLVPTYLSLCLYVMCVLCFMCICVFVYLHVFICLFVCACLSVSPHAIHQIPNVNVRLPTKNQLGFNEARTPCAPHWTQNTHCTNTAQSCNTQQNTKTTPKQPLLQTVDAASTKCTAETWPTAQRALVHCKTITYTLHWIIKEHIAHIMCSTAFYRHISWVLIASMPWQYNLPLVLSAIFSFLF